MAGEMRWNPKMQRFHDHYRLSEELRQIGPYGHWVFYYEHPGVFVFRNKDNGISVYFTPDWYTPNVASVYVQDLQGKHLGGAEVILSPRTGDRLFAIAEPWMDKYDHWTPPPIDAIDPDTVLSAAAAHFMHLPDEVLDVIDAIEFNYSVRGPDQNEPESGLNVDVYGGEAKVAEWTLLDPPDDEESREEWEDNPVVKRGGTINLLALFDRARHRGTYSMDDESVGPLQLAQMNSELQQKAIVAAVISWLSHWGSDGERVAAIGD